MSTEMPVIFLLLGGESPKFTNMLWPLNVDHIRGVESNAALNTWFPSEENLTALMGFVCAFATPSMAWFLPSPLLLSPDTWPHCLNPNLHFSQPWVDKLKTLSMGL
jgi:hypothetical protein